MELTFHKPFGDFSHGRQVEPSAQHTRQNCWGCSEFLIPELIVWSNLAAWEALAPVGIEVL